MTAGTQLLGAFDSFTLGGLRGTLDLLHALHEQAPAPAAEPAGLPAGFANRMNPPLCGPGAHPARPGSGTQRAWPGRGRKPPGGRAHCCASSKSVETPTPRATDYTQKKRRPTGRHSSKDLGKDKTNWPGLFAFHGPLTSGLDNRNEHGGISTPGTND